MKEIKFRGKTRRGEIIYSNGYLNGLLYKGTWHRVVECELFIGVDKDGNEIYEGDKIKFVDDSDTLTAQLSPSAKYGDNNGWLDFDSEWFRKVEDDERN